VTASIAAVSYHLPQQRLTNEDLQREFPDWSVEKIASKTGIDERRIAGPEELSSDLAIGAGRALFEEHGIDARSIDFLIVCTQTPDHLLPSTSLIVHAGLGLRADCGAFDFTLGCSGYVYGLGLARGLIDSGQAGRILLITTDTYSKLLNPADRSVRTIFGDGAAATLLVRGDRGVGHVVYGSDGSGAGALVVPGGGLAPADRVPAATPAARGLEASGYDLYMDGPAVFNFTLKVVPESVDRLLEQAGITRDDVDTWILHQANAFMLGHLRRKLGIPEDRFVVDMADVGNTVSSTIPIALARAMRDGRTPQGSRSVLLGFGVGLSWAGAVVDW
jgi:3-oxoacyl-[acyl-carrier-protein] synthase III